MARQWTVVEQEQKRKELAKLYILENKTIREISHILNIAESSVYDRLMRLHIPSLRHKKLRYNNKRIDITIPRYSKELAEFVGILLGDGHLSPTQVSVTLGKKEIAYVQYVATLMNTLFGGKSKIIQSADGDYIVYQ